jgi:hypothetical protein
MLRFDAPSVAGSTAALQCAEWLSLHVPSILRVAMDVPTVRKPLNGGCILHARLITQVKNIVKLF